MNTLKGSMNSQEIGRSLDYQPNVKAQVLFISLKIE